MAEYICCLHQKQFQFFTKSISTEGNNCSLAKDTGGNKTNGIIKVLGTSVRCIEPKYPNTWKNLVHSRSTSNMQKSTFHRQGGGTGKNVLSAPAFVNLLKCFMNARKHRYHKLKAPKELRQAVTQFLMWMTPSFLLITLQSDDKTCSEEKAKFVY